MNAAGIILAGGKSSRFDGNKAFVEIASQRLIDRIISMLKIFFTSLILVTNTPDEYSGLEVELVTDIIPGKGPLSGIHAGLIASPYSLNFVTACDMPFVSGHFAAHLINKSDPRDDVVVPVLNGYVEPLAAVYRKTCIPYIERSLLAGRYKVTGFYDSVRVVRIPEAELAPFSKTNMFFNINTRDDLKKAFPECDEQKVI